MSETILLTRSAFAARQNWSPSYVTKLGKEGKLVTTPDGKLVDVDATLAKIKRGADPAKEAVRARHEATRIDRDVYSARDTTPDADPSLGHDFQAARAADFRNAGPSRIGQGCAPARAQGIDAGRPFARCKLPEGPGFWRLVQEALSAAEKSPYGCAS